MLWAASLVVLAAASLAGGRSSIEHHDATLAQHDIASRRLSQTPDGCALYIAGPVVASKGNQVATVDSLHTYELAFTMELASDWSVTGSWQSILHIGDTDNQRLPGLWFRWDGALTVIQSDAYMNRLVDVEFYSEFQAGETYEIEIVVQNNQMTVHVDGALVGTGSGSATYAATDMAVYVGDPWFDAAKVTLSDITLSEIALADTCRENAAAMFLYTFQAGRCYPQSEAPVINTVNHMSSTLRRTGTPQECYDYCTGNSGYNIMGLDLRPTGGQDCMCNHPSVKSRER